MLPAKSALLYGLISGPGYGLELIERIRAASDGRLRIGQGSAYPALRSLEREGLVRSWEGESLPERGGRPRRYYELTADGLRAARSQRDTLLTLLRIAETPA